MEKYSSYKDSGVQWLGQIPSHWAVKHLRNFLTMFSEKGFGDTQLLSVTREKGVILRDKEDKEENHNYVPDDLSGYKHLMPGDFVINKMKSWQGSYGVSNYEGIVSPAYFTCKLRGVDPQFFSRAIRSKAYIGFFMQYSKGIRVDQWDLDPSSMKDIPFILPPLDEQKKMVPYLDAATAKIDEAIAQQQRMIDLLNERQKIIIDRAVTEGIDSSAVLVDSGIDYIGDIPSHWVVKRLGVLGQFTKGGNISRDDLDEDGAEPAILYGDIYTKYFVSVSSVVNHISSKTAVESVLALKGDLLMTGSGETKEDIGKTVVLLTEKAYIGGDVIQFKQDANDSRYLSYVLNSNYSQDYRYRMSKGEIVVHIYPYSLKDLRITLPPVDEQKRIVDYLDNRLKAIENLKNVVLQQIAILQERKQIIVNDVVIGKIKV